MWLLLVASGVCVGVEDSGSSSHGDTLGDGSALGITKKGESIYSIPLKLSKKFNFFKVLYLVFTHRSNITTVFTQKFFLLVLIKLNYQSEEQEARQDSYNYQNLWGKSNTSYSILRLPLKVLKKVYWINKKFVHCTLFLVNLLCFQTNG